HSSGISSFKPIRSHIAIPTAHVMPSTSNPSLTRPGKQDKPACSKVNLSQTLPGKPKYVFTLNPSLDMKDSRPIRKWSSLSKLSGPGKESPDCDVSGNGNFESSMATVSNCNAKPCTSGGNVTDNFTHPNTEYLKSQDTKTWNTSTKESPQSQYPLSDGQYKFESLYNAAGDSSLPSSTSSKKHSDLSFSAFTATKATKGDRETCGPRHGFTSLEHQPTFGTTARTSLRTQLWLSDQMLAASLGLRPAERSCAIIGCQLKQRQQQLWQEADQMQAGGSKCKEEFNSNGFINWIAQMNYQLNRHTARQPRK
ncbi:centrosomal protein of 85 kDa-like, partial [Rhinoraja longicauda]